ncbi:MAG: hypothetical protein DRO92_01900 [Candidatus Altiarchaeales archaeon]|nr:MAG: hypothetical protein DRO92_01900 [Candidatus Altiarchaeales archaeon]
MGIVILIILNNTNKEIKINDSGKRITVYVIINYLFIQYILLISLDVYHLFCKKDNKFNKF